MATTKGKTTKTKAAAKKVKRPAANPKTNHFQPGTYIVPKGHVTVAVPTFWTLRQTNDDIQVESEASETTVIVTAYHRNEGVAALDARDYLKHFLETAPVNSKVLQPEGTKKNASARFKDAEGDHWLVRFLSNGKTLLLATCHTNRPLTSREGRTGVAVVESIKLKGNG